MVSSLCVSSSLPTCRWALSKLPAKDPPSQLTAHQAQGPSFAPFCPAVSEWLVPVVCLYPLGLTSLPRKCWGFGSLRSSLAPAAHRHVPRGDSASRGGLAGT